MWGGGCVDWAYGGDHVDCGYVGKPHAFLEAMWGDQVGWSDVERLRLREETTWTEVLSGNLMH